MKKLVLCNWTETERGRRMRPDGVSLHFDEDDYEEFVKRYWDSMSDRGNGIPPSIYSFPNNNLMEVSVTDELFTETMQSEFGKRFYKTPEGIL